MAASNVNGRFGSDPLRIVAYVRVSTSEQSDSGAGLEAQRRAVIDAAVTRGWSLVHIHEDAGLSGKSLNRPGLTAAIAAIETGMADALVVAKLDRLSRSMIDFARLMERSRRKGWAVVALDLGVDTTTPAGEMIANSVANFSQFERRLIGQRTKEALAVKRARGVRLGRPRALSDEIVGRLLELRRAGMTFEAIARRCNEEGWPTAHGGSKWYGNTVRRALLALSPPEPD
jgi:DNA invertase Pin-like site-specific DNA recombinase